MALAAGAIAPVAPAADQLASSALIVQGTVDGVTRALLEASPRPGEHVVSRVVESPLLSARASGSQALVTTRFLREFSRDALATALALDLFADPVLAAVVLHRAGFDGPAGIAERYQRLVSWLALQARSLASLQAAYQVFQAEVAQQGLQAAVPEGFQVMARARIESAQRAYAQAARAYQLVLADQPNHLAMPPVTAELVRAVGEITAVLRGTESSESSPWGPAIRSALESFPRPGASPFR
jgi:hypothetical protein